MFFPVSRLLMNLHKIGLILVSLFSIGCATTPTYTHYALSSTPTGADVYIGSNPGNMRFYKKTPFQLTTTGSLGWSNQYFQARKKGYKDSRLHQQGFLPLGSRVAIDFSLESYGGQDDFAAYQAGNTIPGYYEFLGSYPHSPIKTEVFASIIALIPGSDSEEDEYARLADQYPQAVAQFPGEKKLDYLGPKGLKVRDLYTLLTVEKIGSEILVQKVLGSGGVYKDFDFAEIKLLKKKGMTDDLIAAMIKVTAENKQRPKAPVSNAQPAAVPAGQVAPSLNPTASAEDSGDCLALGAALLACDQGPSGPFGAIRMACKSTAKSSFDCSLPLSEIMQLVQ